MRNAELRGTLRISEIMMPQDMNIFDYLAPSLREPDFCFVKKTEGVKSNSPLCQNFGLLKSSKHRQDFKNPRRCYLYLL